MIIIIIIIMIILLLLLLLLIIMMIIIIVVITTYHGPQFTGMCVRHRGVEFQRIRDFKQYYSNSTLPTSQSG